MHGRPFSSLVFGSALLLATACFAEAPDVGESADSSDGGSGTTQDSTTGSVDATTSTSTSATGTTSTSTQGSSGGTSATTQDDTTGEPTSDCGNGILDRGEECDDGMANGTQPRGCRIDCSGVVDVAWISVWTGSSSGGLDPAGADVSCAEAFGSTARALIAQPQVRVASVTPFAGDGQIDWPLQPHTAYVNSLDEVVWVTDDVALLGVRNGQGEPLWAEIAPEITSFNVWTGLEGDWTTHADNCNGWTNVGFGRVGLLGTTDLAAAISGTTDACSGTQNKLYCVHTQ